AETDEGFWKKRGEKTSKDVSRLRLQRSDPSNPRHPTELRSATFSHKGRRGVGTSYFNTFPSAPNRYVFAGSGVA
ncbi:hypothetical protein, partial [Mesorhizobium sp.]|uniref:hypothetical protein n=1 Tax=Mesorhizobium sp. TaxID=1871066 RepID=UPI00257E0B34